VLSAAVIAFVILVSINIQASDPPQYNFNILNMFFYLLLFSPFLILLFFGIYRISCMIGMIKLEPDYHINENKQ